MNSKILNNFRYKSVQREPDEALAVLHHAENNNFR